MPASLSIGQPVALRCATASSSTAKAVEQAETVVIHFVRRSDMDRRYIAPTSSHNDPLSANRFYCTTQHTSGPVTVEHRLGDNARCLAVADADQARQIGTLEGLPQPIIGLA